MAVAARRRITVEEYDELTRDDPRRTELIDGEIVVVNHPRFTHGRLQARLAFALEAWARERPGHPVPAGPTEVRLTRYDSYGPDLIVVPANAPLTERDTIAVLPLICVEIRSPSTWRYDIGRKKAVYEQHAVPELWLVDGTSREIIVYRRSGPTASSFDVSLELTTADALTSPQLPGFDLPLSELFE